MCDCLHLVLHKSIELLHLAEFASPGGGVDASSGKLPYLSHTSLIPLLYRLFFILLCTSISYYIYIISTELLHLAGFAPPGNGFATSSGKLPHLLHAPFIRLLYRLSLLLCVHTYHIYLYLCIYMYISHLTISDLFTVRI
jgi:hypothetical protein